VKTYLLWMVLLLQELFYVYFSTEPLLISFVFKKITVMVSLGFKQLLFLLLWGAVFLTGCSGQGNFLGDRDADEISTSAGMVEHLRKQNIPALESADVWNNVYGPGIELETRHYQIYSTLIEPLMLRLLPGFVESAFREYNDQLFRPLETENRFTIYLFADRQQWEDFTDEFTGSRTQVYKKIKAGSYCFKGACVAYNIGRERTFSVLGHEGWHQFNGRFFEFRLPSWLDEGIAMLFEASRSEGGMFRFEPGRNLYRLGDLKNTILNDRMIPLEKLLGMNPGEALMSDDEQEVRAFYSQVYALVRFLREEGYGKRLTSYHQMLQDGLNGNWPLSNSEKKIASNRNITLTTGWNKKIGPRLFKEYFGNDLNAIENEYQRFCRKIVYHIKLKR